MIIAVDFDGTIVTHEFPKIGELIVFENGITSFQVLKELQEAGHELILYTMRSGKYLHEAVTYCRKHGLEFWAINKNPEQQEWTSSPKIYAHYYIDDAAIGVPMRKVPGCDRLCVDWSKIRSIVKPLIEKEDE